jgi:tetratricopeptide (TPR) repeat protein
MNTKAAKIILPFLSGLIIISSCNDKKPVTTFDEILAQPPYAGITDSIRLEPTNDNLYFRRAVLLNTNNQPGPAQSDFEKAWSIKKDERYAIAISRLLLEKRPDSAILFLNAALKELPNSTLLQLSLARGYDAQNKPDDALKICDAILQANPQQADVLKMKADLLNKKGDVNGATAALEKAYQLAPFDVELNYILALQYAESKNAKVTALCDSLIKSDTAALHAEPFYYKGIYYSNINEQAKALSSFDEAIKHDYTFMDGYIEKGSLLYEMKKYAEALKVFNLALNISPELPDNFYWIGKCQEAMGQKEEALLNYKRAYGLDNNFKEAKEAAERMN